MQGVTENQIHNALVHNTKLNVKALTTDFEHSYLWKKVGFTGISHYTQWKQGTILEKNNKALKLGQVYTMNLSSKWLQLEVKWIFNWDIHKIVWSLWP